MLDVGDRGVKLVFLVQRGVCEVASYCGVLLPAIACQDEPGCACPGFGASPEAWSGEVLLIGGGVENNCCRHSGPFSRCDSFSV